MYLCGDQGASERSGALALNRPRPQINGDPLLRAVSPESFIQNPRAIPLNTGCRTLPAADFAFLNRNVS